MISKNQIKHIQALHSKKNREEQDLFIIEGVKLVTEFINNQKFEIKEVFATNEFLEKYSDELIKHSVSYTIISADELNKISLLTNPNQVLAVVKKNTYLIDVNQLHNEICLFLDDIRDPGNLGTIIRIADWFGITQIICSPNCTELYNPKTLQATMGAILRVKVVTLNFIDVLTLTNNTPIYGAVLQGENIYTTSLKQGLLVIGNEANGISKEVLSHVTNKITIPSATSNGSESLNAANACAIICAEFHRQLNYNFS